ncbi:7229_t:CDS:2, partial [Gigaspora margarita]
VHFRKLDVGDNRSSIPSETNYNHEDTPAFDITDDTSNSNGKNKSLEDKVIDEFLDLKEKERVSNIIREKNKEKKLGSQNPLLYDKDISQSSKNKVQKFMAEVSKNSSSSISNSNANNDLHILYEKLCNAIILANRKIQEAILCYCNFGKALIQRHNKLALEKKVDLEFNALPANIFDALLWKRIKKAKKLYKLFSTIDNVLFDYSIKIEPTLKSKFSEPSSGSDQQIFCKKENKDSEFSETKITTTITSSILLSHTSNSGDE